MYDVSWSQIGRIVVAIIISTLLIVGLASLYIFTHISEEITVVLSAAWICVITYLTIQNIKEKIKH